ncbi:hypothetical protein [Streptomyces sp. NPDC002962]|uniref:hypothetical protein n=1 Tax=Streptomyces sp. NPDC002962 TaxID=3364674 RepID=UPI0036746D2E
MLLPTGVCRKKDIRAGGEYVDGFSASSPCCSPRPYDLARGIRTPWTSADDVMHRPIGHTVPRISMDDLPEPIRLNKVLVMLPRSAPPTT